MSKIKAGGSAKNIHNNAGRRLGVKRFGGQMVNAGEVIVRQVGSTKVPGDGTYLSRNFTIHAAKSGIVTFKKVKVNRFTGKTAPRTQVMVVDAPTPKAKATKTPAAAK